MHLDHFLNICVCVCPCPVFLLLFAHGLSEPFDPPQNVTFANVTASSVTLLWQAPTEPNGIITHYSIYYSDNKTVTERVRHTAYSIYRHVTN